ncbi:GRB2-associated-binding protein 1-like isoform X6 [Polyodon spathula]|nr:GRB2-associated-binding protein 1-like isoform X6 [Polyodon spathula]
MLLKSGVVESKQQSEQAQHKESFLLLIKAWKKRWFVLRSGRLTGDPDVLEYYKNDHTKKPIRVIDLNLCEQVDAGLTFNKKDLEHSFIFDIKTIDRVFYLVADTEEEMNKWVRCICDICGFNPTDEESGKHPNQCGNTVVEVPLFSTPSMMGASSIGSLPPPYQPVNVRHLESSSSQEEPQDYLWLSNCESKRLEPARPHADSSKSTSSETDCNDNVPSHKPPAATPIPTSSKPASVNGFFPQPILYDSPPSRAVSVSTESSLYNLPRSYSQDPVLLPTKATSSPPVTDSEDIYVFNTPSRKSSVETQLRQFSISYDIPPAPGGGSTYQIPRTGCPEMVVGQSASLPDVPPPRPPKPSVTVPERSPTETYSVPRSVSETDSNYCIPTGPGKSLRSNTLATVDSSRLWKDHGPQDCYDIPRTFPTDRSSSLDLNESFNSYLKNKGMVAIVGGLSASTEEMDENYVHMSANSPSHHHSRSLSEPIQEPNYMPMTPGTTEFSSLGKQVPPPAHMGFRSSPKTPPRRTLLISDCQPPPVDRNLKPDRKGQSPIIIRSKPLGLERTDSQTVGDFPRRFKVKPAPLEIKPMPEWEEFQAPVRSPVTRTFARDSSRFPMPLRPPSVHSTASSTDSQDSDENYVAMNSSQSADEPNVKLGAQLSADGGSSPMVKPKGDKQVEYLDLDLDSGKSTPPRKKKSNGTSNTSSDERVDYVVVDQQRTQALKNTREAWNDGRQSTESEAPSKGTK